MDYAKEKSDWQDKPALKVAEIVSDIDGHIANCPPRCKGACDLSRCPLGKDKQCMHRHLLATKDQIQKTPLLEIAAQRIALLEEARIQEEQARQAIEAESREIGR